MAADNSANVITSQKTVDTATWVQVDNFFSDVVNIYCKTAELMLCVGYDTPLDTNAYLMPASSSIEVSPVPTGKIFMKSVGASQTVYMIGS